MAKKENPEEEVVEAEEDELIHPDIEPDEFISLPPEEEVLRLRKLPVKDLIDELFFSRQRLKNFLQERGVPVPESVFADESHKNLLDLGTSVYIESFSRREILSVPENTEAVNSTVKSFVMLFDSLISTNAFEEVMVSVEGVEEVMTVKQLLEDYDNSKVEEEKKVVVSVHDLRDQLEALIDEDSSGNKNLDDIDDDAIAATREMGDGAGLTYHSKVGEGSYAFSEYSPFISEEMYNNLFSEEQEGNDEEDEAVNEGEASGEVFSDESEVEDGEIFSDESEVEDGEVFSDESEVEDGEVFSDESEVDESAFAPFDQTGASDDDLEDEVSFDDFESFDEKSAEINMADGDEAISEDDIDTLLAAGPSKKVNEKAKMSEDDIEAMMAEAGGAAKPAAKDEKVSEDDIEAMMAEAGGAAKPAAKDEKVSADDIEAMMAEAGDAAKPEAKDEKVSADDIEAMMAEAGGAAKPAAKDEKVSADDIEAMMAEAGGAAKPAAKDEKVSADDIEAMMAEAGGATKPAAKDEKVSADAIEAMMAEAGGATKPAAKDKKVSADDIEAMMAEASENGKASEASPAPEKDSAIKAVPDVNWEKTVDAKTKNSYNDGLISISGAGDFDKNISGSSTKVKDPSEAVSMDKLVDFDTQAAPDEDWEKTVIAKTKHEYDDDLINIRKIQEKLK